MVRKGGLEPSARVAKFSINSCPCNDHEPLRGDGFTPCLSLFLAAARGVAATWHQVSARQHDLIDRQNATAVYNLDAQRLARPG